LNCDRLSQIVEAQRMKFDQVEVEEQFHDLVMRLVLKGEEVEFRLLRRWEVEVVVLHLVVEIVAERVDANHQVGLVGRCRYCLE